MNSIIREKVLLKTHIGYHVIMFFDAIRYYFELVEYKRINSCRILKVMKEDFVKYHYGGNEYKTFQEYKEK